MKPIRTALFAPGIKDKVMAKALESGADAVILDLEDSVPLASKAEARALVAKVIDGVAARAAAWPQIYVRVNGAQTGLLADDLAAVVRPGLNAILLPKVESVEEVRDTAADGASRENARHAGRQRRNHPADRKRARRAPLLRPDQGFAPRRRHLHRRRARRRPADRPRLQLVDRRHRVSVRALQGVAGNTRGRADICPIDGVFSD